MNDNIALDMRNRRIEEHPGLNGLPLRWKRELVHQIVEACKHFTLPKIVDSITHQNVSNFRNKYAINGLDLSATDTEIVETARRRAHKVALMLCGAREEQTAAEIIAHTCKQASVPEPIGRTMLARIKRISCEHWWRRKLRASHARAVENGNIRLGFVRAKREPYASRDAVSRCLRQDQRNRTMMEKISLQNEKGDCFTLQELSDLSTSNKEIRRAELMTRVRGMEDYADEHGYSAVFVTVTCPSYFHATSQISGRAEPNPLYKEMTPRQGQSYLCKVWGKVRAKLNRAGIGTFGLRVAEPHHDGCPHWHLIMFVKPGDIKILEQVIRHYALLDSPHEKGAQKHRCKFVVIDAQRGTATGYVAKYISKNIDGYKVETDSTGEPAITASVHVTAWARTHGIRQFQAFGAGSITVWRELRRIPECGVRDAPNYVQIAWRAAQKKPADGQDALQRADYAIFLNAVGGAGSARKDALIKLAKISCNNSGRYGDAVTERPIGIYAVDTPSKIYESIRYRWERVEATGDAVKPIFTDGAAQGSAALKKLNFGFPWTRVNNCTPLVQRAKKLSGDAASGGAMNTRIFGRSYENVSTKLSVLDQMRQTAIMRKKIGSGTNERSQFCF